MTLAAIGLTVWEGRLLAPSPASAMTLLYGVGVDGRTDLSAEEVRQLVPPEVLAGLNDAAFLDIGPRWGYLVGLAAMVLIALAILVSGAAGGRRPTARGLLTSWSASASPEDRRLGTSTSADYDQPCRPAP
jgi:hypothetical protein